MGAGHFLAVVMLLGTRARRHLFRVPAFPRVATSHAGPRAVNGLAAGQSVACSVAAGDPLPVPSLAGRPSRLVPARTRCLLLSARGPSGSSTARCPGGSSWSSSHTSPRSMARSPFTVATGSKVSALTSSAPGTRSGWAPCSVKLRFYSCLLRCGPVGPLPITPRSKSL